MSALVYGDDIRTRLRTVSSSQNGIALNAVNNILSKPKPTAGTWMENVDHGNTLIKLSQVTPPVTYNGHNWLTYDRLDMAAHCVQGPAKLRVPAAATTHALIPYINRWYGMGLMPEDVVLENVVLDSKGEGNVVVVAHPESLSWIGSFTFVVVPNDAALSDSVTTTSMNGMSYPDSLPAASAVMYAQPYSYTYDFSLQASVLHTLAVGNVPSDLTKLAQSLAAITTHAWVATAAAKYSLDGASITYNGLNSSNMPTNSAYKYVMVVSMGATANPRGTMYLHYNDPDDATSPN